MLDPLQPVPTRTAMRRVRHPEGRHGPVASPLIASMKETQLSDHRDTVVVKEVRSSTGLVLCIIAIILVLAVAWYYLM